MPARGMDDARKRTRALARKIASETTERAIYTILAEGKALSDLMTPVDTSNLINSGFAPMIEADGLHIRGRIGYTAHYAAYVHEAPGTLLGTATPRGASSRGEVWAPRGEPGFLRKGMEQIEPDIPAILRRVYG